MLVLSKGNILKWSLFWKCKFSKELKSTTPARSHLATFQLEPRQCRYCSTFSWQQEYLGCSTTHGAIWWEISQPAEGRQPPPRATSASLILQGAESLDSRWLQWELKADKKLQEMINISETWALKGLRFQMPGSHCRCATGIKLPTALRGCYVGTERGQILMVIGTSDPPKT